MYMYIYVCIYKYKHKYKPIVDVFYVVSKQFNNEHCTLISLDA